MRLSNVVYIVGRIWWVDRQGKKLLGRQVRKPYLTAIGLLYVLSFALASLPNSGFFRAGNRIALCQRPSHSDCLEFCVSEPGPSWVDS
jgi:hypothetical protein